MNFRKATANDIDAIILLYDKVHTAEERGQFTVGWKRGVYPARDIAENALKRDDLFVGEDEGRIVGTAILNHEQPDAYRNAPWVCDAAPTDIMVMHTLVIDPDLKRRGYGRQFAAFYERHALANDCKSLRIDTQSKNAGARAFYKALGYTEVAIRPCTFNGIENVDLVLLEKILNMPDITIKDYTRYCENEILPLYQSVGWTRYTGRPDLLKQAVRHSLTVLAAYDGDRLVGLIRAVGDGCSILYIQDLLVYPADQRRGIGKKLMRAMLDRHKDVCMKVLLTDNIEQLNGFYRAAGMLPAAEQHCVAFIIDE